MMDNKEKDLYVRTRYGEIFKVYSTDVGDGVDYLVYNHNYSGNEMYDIEYYELRETDIEQEANEIRYLCDRFVYHDYYDGKIAHRIEDDLTFLCFRYGIIEDTETPYNENRNFEEDRNYGLLDSTHYLDLRAIKRGVYAAIWTNKGLKYVAQMNNKGELQLL